MLLTGLFLATLFQSLFGQGKFNDIPAIIPMPVEYKTAAGLFAFSETTKIITADTVSKPAAELLNFYLKSVTGKNYEMLASTSAYANSIVFKIDSSVVVQPEGYQLNVSTQQIELLAHDAGGIINGIQTLRQLWQEAGNKSLTIAACAIKDYPRFAYRGMGLDVSRHMFPVSFIKKYIDLLALYKLNTFHWHLTDDQGWRIEIKKYPRLQTVAAFRSETIIGHKKQSPHRFDGKRYGGYYTQQEAKDIVQYAAQRNITVIPEIEMPGHALAALAAYPNLGCTGGPYKTATFWGVFEDVYCAGNDSTFIFLQNVLDEVMAIFPSPKIHIGGDECPKIRWEHCPKCQRRMKELNLKDEHDLQSYFVQRIERYLNSKGRNIIGWDEILEGGLAPNATVMSWRGEAGGIAAAKQQHDVIMTPESHFYFDYYQSLYAAEPIAAGGYTRLEKVYGYEPAATGLDSSLTHFIKGIEGQAWSEYFTSTSQAEYMIFPRMLALAEVAWSPAKGKNYDSFLKRLRQQQTMLKKLDVHAADVFDEINYSSVPTADGTVEVDLQSSLPGMEIRYTTDGSPPGMNSRLYKNTVAIHKTCVLNAILIKDKKPVKRVFHQTFTIHKAIGAGIILNNEGEARFNLLPATLVNGVEGTDRYNDMQWMGFAGKDVEVIVDLGSIKNISTVSMNFLNYHWQKMWAPQWVSILISLDGKQYKNIYTKQNFPISGINKLKAITSSKARYIKIVATNKGVIPVGEYGAGGKALLMIDEITVD